MVQEYRRILAPIDGSNEAELAFQKAVQVAKRNDAKLYIAHVIDTRALQTSEPLQQPIYHNELVDQAKRVLEDYARYAKEAGLLDVESLLEYGSPKVEISRELPKKLQADLIMLGATGLNAVERLFIGSVSEYVIRNAPCDVMIVRTDLDNRRVGED